MVYSLLAAVLLVMSGCGGSESREQTAALSLPTGAGHTETSDSAPAVADKLHNIDVSSPTAASAMATGLATTSATDVRQPIVLELFTSQGCSSCPPADELLRELGTQDDIIALSFHVDYWNYLGWQDPFSSVRWSERQRQYAAHLGARLYTPQLVIQGNTDVVGSDRVAVAREIARQRALPRTELSAKAHAQGNEISVLFARTKPELRAVVALYERGHRTAVKAGENRQRTLQNDYVVRDVVHVKQGERATFTRAPTWGDELGVVVMLQDPDTWSVVAAKKLTL